MNIVITEDESELGERLEEALLESLRGSLPQSHNTSFVLAARLPDGKLVGGLVAATSYGWLLIKVVWVDDASRGDGIGQSLMQHAEQRGREYGCHGAWLDTSSPNAMQFYARLGYAVFGQLENRVNQLPAGHQRWFMQKALE